MTPARISDSLEGRLAAPVTIGNIPVHDLTFAEAVETIVNRALSRDGGYVCTPNADFVVKARDDLSFRSAILGAALSVPDGMWIVYASRIARRGLRGTVTGRLLIPALADRAQAEGLSIGLFGAPPGVAEKAAQHLRSAFPKLQVIGMSPPVPLDVGSIADSEVTAAMVAARPNIVFVGLGGQREVRWMRAHAPEFGGAVLVGTGAGIDFAAGRFRTAPRWMTRIGLEWLFRLAQEPRRLARRYLIEDPWIIWWAVATRLGLGRRG
jgi:exopolysaccharide biosynthesis WecB/TagA/CpsF family protein